MCCTRTERTLPIAEKLALRMLVSSGEPLPEQLLRQLQDALPGQTSVLNIYGCTEVSADATCYCATPLPREAPILPLLQDKAQITSVEYFAMMSHHRCGISFMVVHQYKADGQAVPSHYSLPTS